MGGRESDQQKKLVFCIGWFGSIFIAKHRQRLGPKGRLYNQRLGFID